MQRFKQITPEQAHQKLKHFCAYQERSHRDVREKAYSLGLKKTDVENLISILIEEDLLNESRFATGYARGKFRIKQWGRQKIIQGLKQRQISEYCIRQAMEEIPREDYEKTAHKLAKAKWTSVKGIGINRFVKMAKTRNYMLQKGYEAALISKIINQISD